MVYSFKQPRTHHPKTTWTSFKAIICCSLERQPLVFSLVRLLNIDNTKLFTRQAAVSSRDKRFAPKAESANAVRNWFHEVCWVLFKFIHLLTNKQTQCCSETMEMIRWSWLRTVAVFFLHFFFETDVFICRLIATA